jgi:hypothetical protein
MLVDGRARADWYFTVCCRQTVLSNCSLCGGGVVDLLADRRGAASRYMRFGLLLPVFFADSAGFAVGCSVRRNLRFKSFGFQRIRPVSCR